MCRFGLVVRVSVFGSDYPGFDSGIYEVFERVGILGKVANRVKCESLEEGKVGKVGKMLKVG